MYIDAYNLSPENKELLRAWIEAEGLDANEIVDNGSFSVHKGWISGFKFFRDPEGKPIWHKGRVSLYPFRVRQQHPLPEFTPDTPERLVNGL